MYVVKFQGKVFSKILSIQDHTPALPKSYSGFTKITLRFYQNHWLIFTTSLADFHKITLWFFSKSHSDFSKIALRLYQNHTPTLPKSHSDFTKIPDWFSQNHWLIFEKTRVDFEAPDCCFTVRRFKTAPSPIVSPACQKVSAVSSRAYRVALTVFVLVC